MEAGRQLGDCLTQEKRDVQRGGPALLRPYRGSARKDFTTNYMPLPRTADGVIDEMQCWANASTPLGVGSELALRGSSPRNAMSELRNRREKHMPTQSSDEIRSIAESVIQMPHS